MIATRLAVAVIAGGMLLGSSHLPVAGTGDGVTLPDPGSILYAGSPLSVRTVRGGMVVDLPRGRAVLLVKIEGETAILEPGPWDADLLRQYGVRRIPRYRVPLARLHADFLSRDAWERLAEKEVVRFRERWPGLTDDLAAHLLRGEPWIGMTAGQAEEAVGAVVFARESDGSEGRDVWRIGRRSREAELRQYSEGRERRNRARTFEDHLRERTRALLRFRDGVLVAIDLPD